MEKPDLINVEAPATSCSCCSATDGQTTSAGGRTTTVVDPVCGMSVDPTSAPASSSFEGRTYYFCAAGCRRAFDKDPVNFLAAAS